MELISDIRIDDTGELIHGVAGWSDKLTFTGQSLPLQPPYISPSI